MLVCTKGVPLGRIPLGDPLGDSLGDAPGDPPGYPPRDPPRDPRGGPCGVPQRSTGANGALTGSNEAQGFDESWREGSIVYCISTPPAPDPQEPRSTSP